MDFSKFDNFQLEYLYKQVESTNPVNYALLKQIRFEAYGRGITQFHGYTLDELAHRNPIFYQEYLDWVAAQPK